MFLDGATVRGAPAGMASALGEFGLLMIDYYPVIARCVADLGGSIAARYDFYWLARAELLVQLCGVSPPLTQLAMMRERLALDEAMRKVEDERLSPAAPARERRPMSSPGGQSTRDSSEVRLGTQGRQRQASGGASLEPTSLCLRPLIAFAGVLLVIGLGSTLYWQGDRFTALLVRSPVTLPQFPAKSLPRINYYVGKLGEVASSAIRQAK